MRFTTEEIERRETACPRCGAEAELELLNKETGLVAVSCRDCGRFEMPGDAIKSIELDAIEPPPEA